MKIQVKNLRFNLVSLTQPDREIYYVKYPKYLLLVLTPEDMIYNFVKKDIVAYISKN